MVSTASRISGNASRSMSGIASRVAEIEEPEANPTRKPASAISQAPRPSPQPGMICNAGSLNRVFRATAGGRIGFSPLVGVYFGVSPAVRKAIRDRPCNAGAPARSNRQDQMPDQVPDQMTGSREGGAHATSE